MSEKVISSSEDLRKLQLIELKMIVVVERICRKYQIEYFLVGERF